MLAILITELNFNNILRAAFLFESLFQSFYVLTIWVCNFLSKLIGAKAAVKCLRNEEL